MELRSINPSALAGERSADDDAPRAGRWRTKRSGGRLVRVEIVIALACCAVTMVGVVYLGAQFFDSRPQPPQPQAKGIVWAGRTFVDLAQFSHWLRSRGVAYEVWALRHPTRAGIAPIRRPTIPEAQREEPRGAGQSSTWTTVAGVAVVLAALSLFIGIRRRSWLPRTREGLVRTSTRLAVVLLVAAQRVALAGLAGTRLLLRFATVGVDESSSRARAGVWAAWRQRDTLAWTAVAVLLATISALLVTFWA